jgi:hypothetical protein
MSFKDEVNDAIVHVVSLRQLIQLSRARRPGEKFSEDKEKKRIEMLNDSKKKVEDLPPEMVESLINLAIQATPIELDAIVHNLERVEFLLEDINKGKDKKPSLAALIESFKVTPVIYNVLRSIANLQKTINAS